MARPTQPLNRQRLAWCRQKAQAKFRNEEWDMTFETWWRLWQPLWSERGMGTDNYCMTRQDDDLPWSESNVLLIQRWHYLSNQGPYYKTQHKT